EDALVLTDGRRELGRAPAPRAVQALVPDGEGGLVAGGAHAPVLQRYTLGPEGLAAGGTIALPGARGVAAIAPAGRALVAAEAYGDGVWRIDRAAPGAITRVRQGRGCREARGLAGAGEVVLVACVDGTLALLGAADLERRGTARFPGPLLAVAAWTEGAETRAATLGLGTEDDATASVLRLHRAGPGLETLDALDLEGDEARTLLGEGATLEVFGHARGRRRRVRVEGEALSAIDDGPWAPGVRAAVTTSAGPLTASALLDALVGPAPSQDADPWRVSLAFAPNAADALGERLLTTSFGRPAGAPSCGACHLDGRTDFRTHALGDAAPRPTRSLRGWFRSAGVAALDGLPEVHAGADLDLPDLARTRALAEALAAWEPPPSPATVAGRQRLGPLAQTGSERFEDACAGCHQATLGGRAQPREAWEAWLLDPRGPLRFAGPEAPGLRRVDWRISLDEVLRDVRLEPFAHDARGDGRPLRPAEREALHAFLALL
ncbi:MAG: hypothetical protein AAGH15_06990, partial [Myxococcota bacterium]